MKKLIDSNEKVNKQIKNNIAKKLREKLADISWYMRCLNETIAKMANQEDNCKGRFWEGRFKSQALLDEGALLSAMTYVDLNPIRAKLSNCPELSDFTSIQERIRHYINKKQPKNLMSFFSNTSAANQDKNTIDFSLEDYLTLVDTTGRLIRDDKKGAIPESLSPILERLQLTDNGWL